MWGANSCKRFVLRHMLILPYLIVSMLNSVRILPPPRNYKSFFSVPALAI